MKLAKVLITVLLAGCGQQQFGLMSSRDQFRQSVGEFNNKVDVLFVVDNSSSMRDDQENLASNFKAFIQYIDDQNYDYRIGVTTTDAWKATLSGTPDMARLRDGNGTTHSGVFVIDRNTPNAEEVFLTNAQVGVNGAGDERAFQSFHAALTSSLNPDFRRVDAFLAVIIISDEDDFSHDAATATKNYDLPTLHSISKYVDFLSSFTNSSASDKRFSVSGIYTVDAACRSLKGSGRVGKRYKQLIEATEGVSGSICDASFSISLENIAVKIVELSTQFYLSRVPVVETIKVAVNDVLVQPDEINGWTYHADSNAIRFHGSAIPPQNALISVQFDPVSIK